MISEKKLKKALNKKVSWFFGAQSNSENEDWAHSGLSLRKKLMLIPGWQTKTWSDKIFESWVMQVTFKFIYHMFTTSKR